MVIHEVDFVAKGVLEIGELATLEISCTEVSSTEVDMVMWFFGE
jgi:hypothetical protein